ncbi:MAG: hypothetical protein WBA54_11040 [Acidaminobacteraceae bacterium]
MKIVLLLSPSNKFRYFFIGFTMNPMHLLQILYIKKLRYFSLLVIDKSNIKVIDARIVSVENINIAKEYRFLVLDKLDSSKTSKDASAENIIN